VERRFLKPRGSLSSFEYVMVIVSIIMGLGITALLRGTIDTLRADSGWKPGLLHSLWVANILVLHVGIWSLRWSGERRTDWSFGVLLLFLVLPILLYALAELLFPRETYGVQLSEYFLSNRKTFFGLSVIVWLASGVGPFVFYGGVDPTGSPVVVYLTLAALSGGLAFSSSRRLHVAYASLLLLSMLVSFGALQVG